MHTRSPGAAYGYTRPRRSSRPVHTHTSLVVTVCMAVTPPANTHVRCHTSHPLGAMSCKSPPGCDIMQVAPWVRTRTRRPRGSLASHWKKLRPGRPVVKGELGMNIARIQMTVPKYTLTHYHFFLTFIYTYCLHTHYRTFTYAYYRYNQSHASMPPQPFPHKPSLHPDALTPWRTNRN